MMMIYKGDRGYAMICQVGFQWPNIVQVDSQMQLGKIQKNTTSVLYASTYLSLC